MRSLVLLGLGLAGCRPDSASGTPAGELTVAWAGAVDPMRFTAEATARWCPEDSLVEIFAMRADTGVALVLLARDSLEVGDYPVVSPRAIGRQRPEAGVAVRWLGVNQVRGFESVSGRVSLTSAAALSGTIEATLRATEGGEIDTVLVTGRFARIPMETLQGACGRMARSRG